MITEIDTYRECVEHLMNARSQKPISNGLPQHAAVLFESFFKNAKNSVKIFCRNLDRRVFDNPDVIGAAVDALKRDVSIEIIVQEKSQAADFVAELSDWKEKNIKLNFFDDAGTKSRVVQNMNENFAVMDGDAYRFEPSKHEVKATACMNDLQAAEKLTKIFNMLRASLPRETRNA